MKPLFAILLLCLGPGAEAATYKICVQGNGAQTNSFAWFATNAFQPGDNVYLETTNNTNLPTFYASGTAVNPISIIFDHGSGFSSPTIPANSSWITLSYNSYVIIDGQGFGAIQCTGNGTVAADGGSMPYANTGLVGIAAPGVTGCIFRGLTISNLYNRQTNTETDLGDGEAINLAGGTSNIVSNCVFTGMESPVVMSYGSFGPYGPPSHDLTITHCNISNYNHGITIGSGGTTSYFYLTNGNPLFNRNMISGGVLQTVTLVTPFGDGFQPLNTYDQIAYPNTNSYPFLPLAILDSNAGEIPGTNAVVSATLSANGQLTGFTVSSGGTGYTTNQYIAIFTPPCLSNLFLTHNNLQSGDMYETSQYDIDNGIDLGFHRDGIFVTADTSPFALGFISNGVIAYNYVGAGFHPLSSAAGTAGIWTECFPNQCRNFKVYNNVATTTFPLSYSDGPFALWGIGMLFANNTTIAWQTNGVYGDAPVNILGTNSYTSYNNLILSCRGEIISAASFSTNGHNGSYQDQTNCLSGIVSDYNAMPFLTGDNSSGSWFVNEFILVTGSTFIGDTIFPYATANGWQDWTNYYYRSNFNNFDTHSQTNAFLFASTNNGVPIPAANQAFGTNLTALGITDDYFGNARPATGNWDIGAVVAAAPASPPQLLLYLK